MRKLYNELFYVSKHGKIHEKVMVARLSVTLSVVLICLMMMSLAAFAFFSCRVTSATKPIEAADFRVNLSIQTDPKGDAVPVKKVDSRTYTAALEKGETYLVTLKKEGTAKTGFCILTAKDSLVESYHTRQLGKGTDAQDPNVLTFKLIPSETTVVTLQAHWGTSSYFVYEGQQGSEDRYIEDNEPLALSIKPSEKALAKEQESEEETKAEESKEEPSAPEETPSAEASTPALDEPTRDESQNAEQPQSELAENSEETVATESIEETI